VRNKDEYIYKMKIEKKQKVIRELTDAVCKSGDKKGLKPLTDDIYNITKDNKV